MQIQNLSNVANLSNLQSFPIQNIPGLGNVQLIPASALQLAHQLGQQTQQTVQAQVQVQAPQIQQAPQPQIQQLQPQANTVVSLPGGLQLMSELESCTSLLGLWLR